MASANADDPFADRKRLSFEQAEGVQSLPSPLRLKEISDQLRALLWHVVYQHLETCKEYSQYGGGPHLQEPWLQILYDMHVFRQHRMADDFKNSFDSQSAALKEIFLRGDYVAVFGTVQWLLRHRMIPYGFSDEIAQVLEITRAAYRVLEERTIVPIGSEAEGKIIQRAFADLNAAEFQGARAHLRNAAEVLTQGKPADSIRESIHAVESVARVLEPNADLSKALARLETSAKIHGALKSGFASIYGYTSDERGIRHSLLDAGAPAVDETDALFMLGACAAFTSYLINKARTAGLLGGKKRD